MHEYDKGRGGKVLLVSCSALYTETTLQAGECLHVAKISAFLQKIGGGEEFCDHWCVILYYSTLGSTEEGWQEMKQVVTINKRP